MIDSHALDICSQRHGDALVLAVSGELDLATVPQLGRALDDAANGASPIIVDLRALEFMDSSGVHVLLQAQERCAQAGRPLSLIRGSRQVQRLLELTGSIARFAFADASPGVDRLSMAD